MTTYFNFPSEQLQQELAGIAKAIVAPGKGLKTITSDIVNVLKQTNIKYGTLYHTNLDSAL